MKAVRIVRPGGVEGLEVCEVETPGTPTADRVLVRVRAAALNRADVWDSVRPHERLNGFGYVSAGDQIFSVLLH